VTGGAGGTHITSSNPVTDGSRPVVDYLDQSFSAEANVFFLINVASSWVGQTYTAAKTGRLVGAAVDVGAINTNHALRVAVYDVGAGLPIATLSEVTVLTGISPLGNILTFANPIQQTAGHQYAIVANYPNALPPSVNTKEGTWYGSSDSEYEGGNAITSTDGVNWNALSGVATDLRFATYVTPN
jgi:hypothetical protein